MFSKDQDWCVSGGPRFGSVLENNPSSSYYNGNGGLRSDTLSGNKLVQGCR